jgi:hypothetical protein
VDTSDLRRVATSDDRRRDDEVTLAWDSVSLERRRDIRAPPDDDIGDIIDRGDISMLGVIDPCESWSSGVVMRVDLRRTDSWLDSFRDDSDLDTSDRDDASFLGDTPTPAALPSGSCRCRTDLLRDPRISSRWWSSLFASFFLSSFLERLRSSPADGSVGMEAGLRALLPGPTMGPPDSSAAAADVAPAVVALREDRARLLLRALRLRLRCLRSAVAGSMAVLDDMAAAPILRRRPRSGDAGPTAGPSSWPSPSPSFLLFFLDFLSLPSLLPSRVLGSVERKLTSSSRDRSDDDDRLSLEFCDADEDARFLDAFLLEKLAE